MANINVQDIRQRANPASFAPNISPFFGLLPESVWDKTKDFFIYATDYNALATGATTTNAIAIQADSDFLIVAAVRDVQSTAAAQTQIANLPATATIVDATSGRQLSNQAVHVENLFGTAQNPAYWPMPRYIRANSTLQVTLANLDNTNSYIVRVAFWGFKIFGY